jgi:hypothetical protein
MTAGNVLRYLGDLSALIERRYRIPFRLKAVRVVIRRIKTWLRWPRSAGGKRRFAEAALRGCLLRVLWLCARILS